MNFGNIKVKKCPFLDYIITYQYNDLYVKTSKMLSHFVLEENQYDESKKKPAIFLKQSKFCGSDFSNKEEVSSENRSR